MHVQKRVLYPPNGILLVAFFYCFTPFLLLTALYDTHNPFTCTRFARSLTRSLTSTNEIRRVFRRLTWSTKGWALARSLMHESFSASIRLASSSHLLLIVATCMHDLIEKKIARLERTFILFGHPQYGLLPGHCVSSTSCFVYQLLYMGDISVNVQGFQNAPLRASEESSTERFSQCWRGEWVRTTTHG